MRWLLILLLFISFNSNAQYPFEKYPALNYDTVPILNHGTEYHHGFYSTHKKGFRRIAIYKTYKLVFLCDSDTLANGTNLLLYHNNHIIKQIKISASVDNDFFDEPLYVGDIDGNGLPDFKIVIGNNGCGAAADAASKIYLFNEGNNKFKMLSFFDLFSYVERDLNKEGHYEIISQEYDTYKKHAYYIFNLYSFKNGRLINVSKKFNYPLAVKDLFEPSFTPTNKIPKSELLKLARKYPSDYSHD